MEINVLSPLRYVWWHPYCSERTITKIAAQWECRNWLRSFFIEVKLLQSPQACRSIILSEDFFVCLFLVIHKGNFLSLECLQTLHRKSLKQPLLFFLEKKWPLSFSAESALINIILFMKLKFLMKVLKVSDYYNYWQH